MAYTQMVPDPTHIPSLFPDNGAFSVFQRIYISKTYKDENKQHNNVKTYIIIFHHKNLHV